MLMLLYVLVAVPLSVAFAIETELWSTVFVVDMIVVRVAVCPCSLCWVCNTGCLRLPLP